ncbi:hypothetical protein [uncultured Roseobacter sp.]|uniref:hypothetical protein n=1 Tax=uncultured Roseobacter sp. TaxID=114847 RepID=UPI002607BB42|nr:hypothetical protein [uncultured Roseobacter sp.]
MKWRFVISLCVLSALAAPAWAQPNVRLAIQFEKFPEGTQCGVEDSYNPVRVFDRKGKPRLLMVGFVSVGQVYCDLPGGKRIGVDVNKRLRPQTRTVGFRIFPSGRAVMTTSVVGGIIKDELQRVITPWK